VNQWNKIVSSLLLVVLAMAIIPAESFHSHEEHLIICHDQSDHVEESHFECQLCDFVLPVLEQNHQEVSFYSTLTNFKYNSLRNEFVLLDGYNAVQYRGPPTLV